MGMFWKLPKFVQIPSLFLEHPFSPRPRSWYQQRNLMANEKLKKINPELAKNYEAPPEYWEYTFRDVILYAMGIGCRPKYDLQYVYENHEHFTPLPTYIVAPGVNAMDIVERPGIVFDINGLVHGEQYIKSFRPLPPNGKLRSERKILDILDKKSGAQIIYEITTYDDNTNEKLAIQQIELFQIGAGSFGGLRDTSKLIKASTIPDHEPDSIVEEHIPENQAHIYRLGGLDLNPLHADYELTKSSPFKQPILHGLCTMGYTFRHLLGTWGHNDASSFNEIKVRFTAPVYPGQTIITESWKDDNRIIFQTKVKETGKVALSHGWITFKNLSEKPIYLDNLTKKM